MGCRERRPFVIARRVFLTPIEIAAIDNGTADTPDIGDGPETGGDGETDLDLPVEPECSCEATGENRCELQEIECEIDADCPAGMVCDASQDISCVASEDGEEVCSDPEVTGQCRPEGWDRGDSISAGDTMKEDATGENDGLADDGEDAPEANRPADNDEEPSDPGDGSGGDQDISDPETPDTADPGEADPNAETSGEKADPKTFDPTAGSGDCSVVAPAAGGSSAVALLALFSFLTLAWRRLR